MLYHLLKSELKIMSVFGQESGHCTAVYACIVLNFLLFFCVQLTSADVTVINYMNFTTAYFEDREAQFGPDLSDEEKKGYLIYVTPKNACIPVEPPLMNNITGAVWIALIARGGCQFSEKVFNAQEAGYGAAIIHNYKNEESLLPMAGGDYGDQVNIPSVFVGFTDGLNMAEKYCYDCEKARTGYYQVKLQEPDSPAADPYLLWPFAVVVGTCFILMLMFMIFKWCRDVRRQKKSRLSTKHLKKIPVKKFKKGDEYDVCAICLDDYEEGEKLRVLPCSHAYHCKCIDPWLTKNKRTCPVCKRKVFPGDADSDSESEDEAGGAAAASERTPLLAGPSSTSEMNTRQSTFDNSGLPEAMRSQVRRMSNEYSRGEETDSESDTSSELDLMSGNRHLEEDTPEFVVVERESAQVNDAFSNDNGDVAFAADTNTEGTQLSQVV